LGRRMARRLSQAARSGEGMRHSAAVIAMTTDLYELTMAASYMTLGMNQRATFSLVHRRLPLQRGYLVVAGLAEALERLQCFRFDAAAIDYLRRQAPIAGELLERLEGLRFTGDVRAVPEGRVVFAGEPILEVDAPLIEAQLVETMMLNAIHYPTAVASKAARCVAAAPGKALVDFGLRRMPGIEAGLAAARAAYIAGFDSTSNLLAGQRYGIPVAGTLAHSYIEAFDSEIEALEAFAHTFPGPATLLVDTYDTIRGTEHAITVAKRLKRKGTRVMALRLDSGNIMELSRKVRRMLDEAGLRDVGIFASGGLDEYELARLVGGGAPIDGFGVGTRLGMSADAPVLDLVYKLCEYAGEPRLKLSSKKETIAGPKQIWRRTGPDGCFAGDRLATLDEVSPGPGWEPLLEPVMIDGRPRPLPTLDEIRQRHREEVARLPEGVRRVSRPGAYPVRRSAALAARHRHAVRSARRREGLDSASR
jgi:nicotinate phosphoribosyltransferase